MKTTRYMFFSGKGGVGKTSVACSTAIYLASKGNHVLLVSTDPASNLDDVFEIRIGQEPMAIKGVPGLKAMNLDPEEAARVYREELISSYRDIFPADVIASMEEQLSGACTVEIAAFSLFTRLLTDTNLVEEYQTIIFDTAPTGHTLRLLSLPRAWSGFLSDNAHGTSCIGPLAGLQAQKEQYEKTVAALSDPSLTMLTLVSKPDIFALSEAARASQELKELGMANQQLIINSILMTISDDLIAKTFRQQQQEALNRMPPELAKMSYFSLPLLPVPPIGIAGLKQMAGHLFEPQSEIENEYKPGDTSITGADYISNIGISSGLGPIVDDLSEHSYSVILVMGKGGVGKTTIAAAIALALAHKGHPVHLSTTDPAAHLSLALSGAGKANKNLSISRINPELEVKAYREEVMATVGEGLDAEGKALLQEDLASPCTEEIAVFRAFARTVAEIDKGFVVMDTAPTGHTLLLLDNTLAYHRQVEQSTGEIPEEVRLLLPRLRDPRLTKVILVSLAQATPVLEASRLQDDLLRASITPFYWVLNQTWTGVDTSDPVLASLAREEQTWIEKVVKTLAPRTVYIPWQPVIPTGASGLYRLIDM
jgi:arsenite-transporting ATPase